ncbi:MAG: hypothetical protein Q4A65_08440 [Bacillota bacterium]|nr:hypothetical protein [Bacillota bacterium]
MSKPNFTVIKGGLTSSIKDMPKHFVSAYVTDTRLMGVLAVYARWHISGGSVFTGSLHQFFYIDCEEAGLETYKSIRGESAAEVEAAEQALVGGLGARKKELTERQLRYLLCKYKSFNEKRGLPLPEGIDEYDFMLEPETTFDKAEAQEFMTYICDEISTDYQVVNYFLMRCFGNDYEGALYLAPVTVPEGNAKAWPLINDFPLDIYRQYDKATFCKNTIDIDKRYADGGVAYLCESLIEMNGNYDIQISKVVVKDLKVIGFEHCSGFRVSAAEAAMMLAKPEFCTSYEVLLSEEEINNNLGEFTIQFGTIMSIQNNGRLFMAFKQTNDHVNDRVFMLSNDVGGIYFLTDYGQLIIAAYSLRDVMRLESTLAKSVLAPYLELTNRYEFQEPLLFEFIRSDFENFEDFLDFLGI